MYKREFLNLLNQKKLPESILLYGACDYQIDYYTNKILKQWEATPDDVLTFYFDAYDFKLAKAHLSQSSLFGNQNILHVKSDKPLSKPETQTLLEITTKSRQSRVFGCCYIDDGKLKTFASNFSPKLGANSVRFFKPSTSEAISYLAQAAKEIGLNIQPYALSHLYGVHNEDLRLAVSELDKLSILDKEIQASDIDKLVYGSGMMGIETFIQNILAGKPIANDFKNLLESGQIDEIRLINAMQNYITQLFTFYAYIKLHGSCDARAILGYPLPEHIASIRAKESMRFNTQTYQSLLSILVNTELTLKTQTHADKPSTLLSCILSITKLIKN
jgi:DNA polymerase-3 subunit delta